jgi:hypothetical protein
LIRLTLTALDTMPSQVAGRAVRDQSADALLAVRIGMGMCGTGNPSLEGSGFKRGWRKEWSVARAAIEKALIRDAGHIAKSN